MNLREVLAVAAAVYALMAGCLGHIDSFLWRKVSVSQKRLNLIWKTQNTSSETANSTMHLSYLACHPTCSKTSWCQLFCYDPESQTCSYYDMIVKPGYMEPTGASTDLPICYTKLTNDYAVGSAIGGTPYDPTHSTKLLENLVDGIYGYRVTECYKSIYEVDPWIYLDLGGVRKVRSVTLFFQSSSLAYHQYNYEVRTHPDGPVPVLPGTGEFLGNFSHQAMANEEIPMETGTGPVDARYITIQRFTDSVCNGNPVPGYAYCCIQLCHIEII